MPGLAGSSSDRWPAPWALTTTGGCASLPRTTGRWRSIARGRSPEARSRPGGCARGPRATFARCGAVRRVRACGNRSSTPRPPARCRIPPSLTFVTPASRPHFEGGRTLWSDLSFVEADEHLPEAQRRVVLTALRALRDHAGEFAGVLRLGLRTETIDRIVHEEQQRAAAQPDRALRRGGAPGCAPRSGATPWSTRTGRCASCPGSVPEEIRLALRDEGLRQVDRGSARRPRPLLCLGERPFLASYRALPRTPGLAGGGGGGRGRAPGMGRAVAAAPRPHRVRSAREHDHPGGGHPHPPHGPQRPPKITSSVAAPPRVRLRSRSARTPSSATSRRPWRASSSRRRRCGP